MTTSYFSEPVQREIIEDRWLQWELRRWCVRIKAVNDPASKWGRPTLCAVDNTGIELAEMLDYPRSVAILIYSLKRERVRLYQPCFTNENATHKNPHIAIVGGDAAEFVHRVCKSIESRTTTH